MDYIAVLDHEHLDNGLFLSSFARALSSHKGRGIILHSDSKYTDRLIQTGMMREGARIRAIKDLNHRLVALFADEGVATIGVNGYQRELIKTSEDGEFIVDTKQFHNFPVEPMLLVSSLIYSEKSKTSVSSPIEDVANALRQNLDIEHVILFSISESGDIIKENLPERITNSEKNRSFIEEKVPKEFRDINFKTYLTTARDFSDFPKMKNFTVLEKKI